MIDAYFSKSLIVLCDFDVMFDGYLSEIRVFKAAI